MIETEEELREKEINQYDGLEEEEMKEDSNENEFYEEKED